MNAALSNNVFAILPRRIQKILDIVQVKKWSLVGKELRLWLIFSRELTPTPSFLATLHLKVKLHSQPRVIEFALKHLQPDKEQPGRYCFIFSPPTWWNCLIINWRGEGRNIQKIVLCAEEQQKEIYEEEKLI